MHLPPARMSPLSSPHARILGVTFLPVSTYNSNKKRGVEMELILIGTDKLKVMLTEEDMKFYAIEFERLDYGNTETRRAIWSILDEAKRQIGFDAARDRIYIQAYKNIAGGCELFVSCADAGQKSLGIKKLLYRFDSMASLLCACRLLSGALCRRQYGLFRGRRPLLPAAGGHGGPASGSRRAVAA